MSEHNGKSESPGKTVCRNTADLFHDVVTLAELQSRLLKAEAADWSRGVIAPAAVLGAALGIALGCVPVLLLGLAYSLIEFADWSPTVSLLVAGVVGLFVACVSAAVGVRRLRNNQGALERSVDEFTRNVNWMKRVLKQNARSMERRSRREIDVPEDDIARQ